MLSQFFPNIPGFIFGTFFSVAFVVLLVSFVLRMRQIQTIKILSIAALDVDNLSIWGELTLIAFDQIHIGRNVMVKLDRGMYTTLKNIVKIGRIGTLKTNVGENVISLSPGECRRIEMEIPIEILDKKMVGEFRNIDFDGKIKIGIVIIGDRKMKWEKIDDVGLFF